MPEGKKKYRPQTEIDDLIDASLILSDPTVASKVGTGEIEDWGGGAVVEDRYGDQFIITGNGAKRIAYGL